MVITQKIFLLLLWSSIDQSTTAFPGQLIRWNIPLHKPLSSSKSKSIKPNIYLVSLTTHHHISHPPIMLLVILGINHWSKYTLFLRERIPFRVWTHLCEWIQAKSSQNTPTFLFVQKKWKHKILFCFNRWFYELISTLSSSGFVMKKRGSKGRMCCSPLFSF